MLFKVADLHRIAAGEIRLAFRRWRKPSVAAGGTLRTAIGVLDILEAEPVAPDQITDADAQLAGYADRASLLGDLDRRQGGQIFRIEVRYAGEDPRLVLRKDTSGDIAETIVALARIDAGRDGPWTLRALAVIGAHPGVVSTQLAERLELDRLVFKRRVRRLKDLGLTESLDVGYRLSPRGEAVLTIAASQNPD